MDFSRISVFLLQIFILCATIRGAIHSFPADISINCGSSESDFGINGIVWIGDARPGFSSSAKLGGVSKSSIVVPKLKKVRSGGGGIPYSKARVSRSRFWYEFEVNPGQKVIRLHFSRGLYKGFKDLVDLFTVEAGGFTLLSNFSASMNSEDLGVDSFSKEFYLSFEENRSLTIAFSPVSVAAYAFINGIEIISLASSVSYFTGGFENGLQVVGEKSLVNIDQTTALEMVHKKTIRHGSVDGFYRVTETVVPSREGDKITNVVWEVPVDVGFRYLIRIHFSGLVLKMLETRGVVFDVLVNGMIAYSKSGTNGEADSNGSIPAYKDYVLILKGKKQEEKRDVLISLQANEEFIDGHGPLKGFEIFRLSNPDNSLAIPNPLPAAFDSYWGFQSLFLVLGQGNMMATVVLTVLVVGNIAVYLLQQIWEVGNTEEENMPSARAKGCCRRFSLAQIRLATRNFSEELFIGKGGFGRVYKGLIGEETVAIKRLKSNSQQGSREFLTEIETLSGLRHINLVSLIGYCNEQREMILVYEYMECGTLADLLHKVTRGDDNSSSLTWEQRLKICIGAGRGIEYLHTGISLIHRDVKSSNILLDKNLTPKISDFGIARQGSRSELQSHVSTNVKGTRGYLDPYYFSTHKLTRESDTYAFGVVLLETLCERPAIDFDVPCYEQILTTWAQKNISEGKVNEIVASSLRGEISEENLKAFVDVAERCLQAEPEKRPTMAQVVVQLESVLQQKGNATSLVLNRIIDDPDNIDHDLPVDTRKQGITSSNEPNQISTHPQQQTNVNMINIDPSSGRKSRTSVIFKFRSWQTFWKRVKPFKQDGFWPASEGYYSRQLKIFPLQELRAATDNFSNKNFLRRRCFYRVYKGQMKDGTLVTVKRLKKKWTTSEELEFQTEAEMMSKVVHHNIIALQGICVTSTERLLVYPYMANGDLASCLRNRLPNVPPLNWLTRKHIALGSAQGLSHLHDYCDPKIIHRDIKAANIFLDESFEAVVSDFGLAKLMDSEDTHVTTVVKGTIGHIASEYLSTGKTSEKTDIYAYGVMLLELVTGQKTFDLARHELMLVDWVKTCLQERSVEMLVDPDLNGDYLEEEVVQVIQVALLCTRSSPMERPKMLDVVKMLDGHGLAERWDGWQRDGEVAVRHGLVSTDSCTMNAHAVELSGPR